MNMSAANFTPDLQPQRNDPLIDRSAAGFRAFDASLTPLRQALSLVQELGDKPAVKAASKLCRELDRFEPSVTLIGQIKSGKSTLANAMIGWPSLLPADVNPWTSVVTSLHLRPDSADVPATARFEFFNSDEWDRLVAGGGRIGELAARAGAETELQKIRQQIDEMREKSRARLGRKFELLLGQHHSYGYVDRDLVERYVCLGDEPSESPSAGKKQGRFADITKSADIQMWQPAMPIRLCLRDTPGVNDTFLMREQITIRAIRESRICVIVLSAHQALSSTDLALIRLISNIKSRNIVIFVNRIDELSDPVEQIDQIEKSIRSTLDRHNGPADAEIVFGSALWAEYAGLNKIDALPEASKDTLLALAETDRIVDRRDTGPVGHVWDLSGMPDLFDAVATRVADGEGRELIERVASATQGLLQGISASQKVSEHLVRSGTAAAEVRTRIEQSVHRIRAEATGTLDAKLAELHVKLVTRMERSHHSFLSRAIEALAKHLEHFGELSEWRYDPSGLRLLLNSAFRSFGNKAQAAFTQTAEAALAELAGVLRDTLDLPNDDIALRTPPAPHVRGPVTLGQTIALDLRSSWWTGWWNRRRSYKAQAEGFHDLILSETQSLLSDLSDDQAVVVCEEMRARLAEFLDEQFAALPCLSEATDSGRSANINDHAARVAEAKDSLERYIA